MLNEHQGETKQPASHNQILETKNKEQILKTAREKNILNGGEQGPSQKRKEQHLKKGQKKQTPLNSEVISR